MTDLAQFLSTFFHIEAPVTQLSKVEQYKLKLAHKRAAAAGLTIEEWQLRVQAEDDKIQEVSRICNSRDIQRAILSRHAARSIYNKSYTIVTSER